MPNNNFFGKDYVDSKRIIYTPSAFARKNLFYLQEIGTLNALIKHKNVRDNLDSFFKSLWQKADSDSRFRDVEINECISSLLTNICNEGVPVQDNVSVYRRDVQEIANYISENLRNKISLDELSQRFFINKYYLTRVFKEQFGVTINHYITSIRITEAKRALRFSDESVENIGYNCGLGAPHYFSRTFKRVEGISPSEFRKKWQRK